MANFVWPPVNPIPPNQAQAQLQAFLALAQPHLIPGNEQIFQRMLLLDTTSQRLQSPKWKKVTNPDRWNQEELQDVIGRENAPNDAFSAVRFNSQRKPSYRFNPKFDRPNMSAVGTLSYFPNELIGIIIEQLDTRSIEMFSRTCRLARYIVETNSGYRMMMNYMPRLRHIISNTGLFPFISIRDIRRELEWPNCRSCNQKAACLFLATCERICHNCLQNNPSYWLMPINDAAECFALGPPDFDKLPVICHHEITYKTAAFPERSMKEVFLVPVRVAMKATLKKWGSWENCMEEAEAISPDRGRLPSSDDRWKGQNYRWFRNRGFIPEIGWCSSGSNKMKPFRSSSFVTPAFAGFPPPQNEYSDWSHVKMPFVPSIIEGSVTLYFCRGCEWRFKNQLRLRPDHLRYCGFSDGTDLKVADRELLKRALEARTWEETVKHSRKCLGAGVMMWEHAAFDPDGWKKKRLP